MSENRITAEFCKSGTLHRYSRRFHLLTREAKQKVIELIQSGIDADKAIRRAKRGN